MTGSIREIRPGKWELRVFVGRDEAGQVRHRQRTVNGNRRAAEREMLVLLGEVEAVPELVSTREPETPLWGPRTTINDAIAAWRANGWEDLSPSTTRRYESICSVQVRDSIGKRRIADLSSYDVERFFRGLKNDGLSEASVRQVRAVLNRACRLARKWSGNVLPNPVADSELPTWSIDSREEVRAPTADEVRRLLIAAGGHEPRMGVLVRVITATGVRRGEACGITWTDVDWDAATILVNKAVVGTDEGVVVRSPKTRASIRKLVVDEETLAQLRALHDEQAHLAFACDRALSDESYVFSFEPGGTTPPHPDAASHAFSKIRHRAGVPSDIHLHSLRHFQATVLDTVISERQKQARLGWSTVQMARHYTDVIREEDRRAAEHVGRVLDDTADPQDGQ